MSESNEQTTQEYCRDQVRQFDRDRYLCLALTPTRYQDNFATLYAFNSEISRIHSLVSESALGEIRLQWWRDNISNAFTGGPRPQGIAGALHDVIINTTLPQPLFHHLIDAHAQDLNKDIPATLQDLETYAMGITSPLIQLAIRMIQPSSTEEISDLVKAGGTALGLVSLLRKTPQLAAQGHFLIPRDIMAEVGLEHEHAFMPSPDGAGASEPLRAATKIICDHASDHLKAARVLAKSTLERKAIFPALLPLVHAAHYLSVLNKVGYDPYARALHQPRSAKKALKLSFANWTKRF